MKPPIKYWRPTYIQNSRISVWNQKYLLQKPVKNSLIKSGNFPAIAWDEEILQAFMAVFNAYPLYKPASEHGGCYFNFVTRVEYCTGMYGKVRK